LAGSPRLATKSISPIIGEIARSRPAEILLAEDNKDDVELTRQFLNKCKLLLNLHHVRDGVECMDFLRMEGKYSQAPTPVLLLLDMNMPLMDGREVLAEMAADKTPNAISVIVLTPSAEDEEILKMYKLRSRSYIIKPLDFDNSLIPTLPASLLLQRARPGLKSKPDRGGGDNFSLTV
jgi:two-component system response regulator